jgi:rod shape-determining protein MreD
VRYLLGATAAFFLAMFQASSVEQIHVLGVIPNLLLVILVCWLVVRGLDDVMPMVAVTGITLGFVGLQTPGLALFALLLAIAPVGLLREMHVVSNDLLLSLALVALSTLIYETALLAGVMATGGVFDVRGGFWDVVAPAVIVNACMAPVVYVVMRLAKPRASRNRYAY